jgi:hypothetical protein
MEGVYALNDREAVTYASVCASNKRYQVAIDAWEPIHRLWQVFPSLGSTIPQISYFNIPYGRAIGASEKRT